MALLTIPSGLSKGSPFSVTLDKSELFSLTAVVSNSHFSNQSNVSTCLVKYQGDVEGALFGHSRLMRFDLSQATPSHTMSVSSAAANVFSISQILLVDNDGAVFSVPASEIPSLNLDFSGGAGNGGGGDPGPASFSLSGPPTEGNETVTFNWSYGSNVNQYVILTHADYAAGLWVKVAVLGPITDGTATINKADILALGLNQPKQWPYALATTTDAAGNNRTGFESYQFNLALNLYDAGQPSTVTYTSSNSDGIYVNVNWSYVNVPLDSKVALMMESSPGSNSYVDLVSDAGLATGGSYYAYSLPQGYVRGANFKLDLRSSTGTALGVSSAVFQIPTHSTISVTSYQVVDGDFVIEWTGSALDSGEYVVLAHARYDLGIWEKVAVLGPISAQTGSVPQADLLALEHPEWPLKLIVTSDSAGTIGQGYGQGLQESGTFNV